LSIMKRKPTVIHIYRRTAKNDFMANELECSKCSEAMTKGFIIDHGHYNTKQQQTRVEGSPRKSRFGQEARHRVEMRQRAGVSLSRLRIFRILYG
jgi:hypothetical protein